MNNKTNTSVCLALSQAELESYKNFEFWTNDVAERIVGTIGLFVNCIAIIVLTRKKMANNFNLLLTGLAIFDNMLIIFGMLDEIENSMNSNIHFDSIANFFWYPLYHMSMCASIYMTIALSIERYKAVTNPTSYHISHRLRLVLGYIFGVLLISIISNIPKFFEMKIHVSWIQFVDDQGRKMNESRYHMKDRQAYIILFSVVFILAICHSLRIFSVINLIVDVSSEIVQESINNKCQDFEQLWVVQVRLVSNLLLTINSSINFFIYYHSNKAFRKILFQSIKCQTCSDDLKNPESDDFTSRSMNNELSVNQ